MSVSGKSSATRALATVTGAVVIAGSGELAIGVVRFASPVVAFGFSVGVATFGCGVLADEAVVDVASPIGALGFSLAGAAAGTETGTISTRFGEAGFGAAFTFEAAAAFGSPIMRASLAARFEFSSRSFLYVSFDWLVRPST